MSIAVAVVSGVSGFLITAGLLDLGIAHLFRIPKEANGGHD